MPLSLYYQHTEATDREAAAESTCILPLAIFFKFLDSCTSLCAHVYLATFTFTQEEEEEEEEEEIE